MQARFHRSSPKVVQQMASSSIKLCRMMLLPAPLDLPRKLRILMNIAQKVLHPHCGIVLVFLCFHKCEFLAELGYLGKCVKGNLYLLDSVVLIRRLRCRHILDKTLIHQLKLSLWRLHAVPCSARVRCERPQDSLLVLPQHAPAMPAQ